VTTKGVGWASEEVSDLVAPPLNLVLYHAFEHDEDDLFYQPVLVMYHRTCGAPEGCVLVLDCTLDPNKVPITDVGHSFVFQNTDDPGRIVHGGRVISRTRDVLHIVSCVRFRYGISFNWDVMSSHIVWRNFSSETYKNYHSGVANRTNPHGSVVNICDEHRCVLLIRIHKCVGCVPGFVRDAPPPS
jgi:hypothetical protein